MVGPVLTESDGHRLALAAFQWIPLSRDARRPGSWEGPAVHGPTAGVRCDAVSAGIYQHLPSGKAAPQDSRGQRESRGRNMRSMGVWMTGLAVGVTVVALLLSGSIAASAVAAGTSAGALKTPGGARASWVDHGAAMLPTGKSKPAAKILCTMPAGAPGAIYAISKAKAYVLDWGNGTLYVCGGGKATVVATPPSGFASGGYYGLSGAVVNKKLVLLALSFGIRGGYYCLEASVKGCAWTVPVSLPSTFCSSEPMSVCNPDGVVLETNLSFTYVDVSNVQMVTCTAWASSCSVDAASSAFAGYLPVNIAQSGTTLAVSDNSCSGVVWTGSTTSMTVAKSFGDSLQGLAYQGSVLYAADDAVCTSTAAHLVDVGTGAPLTTPFTAPAAILGISSDLQFASLGSGVVYLEL